MLDHFKDEIELRTEADYKRLKRSFNTEVGAEDEHDKLHLLLSDRTLKNSFCCPKHAPVSKIKRTKKQITCFIVSNMIFVGATIFLLFKFADRVFPDELWDPETWHLLFHIPLYAHVVLFLVAIVLYSLAACRDPGFAEMQKEKYFAQLLN